MLSPLTIVSIDQGKLYGPKPTVDDVLLGMQSDLGVSEQAAADVAKAGLPSRPFRRWLLLLKPGRWARADAGKLQPDY